MELASLFTQAKSSSSKTKLCLALDFLHGRHARLRDSFSSMARSQKLRPLIPPLRLQAPSPQISNLGLQSTSSPSVSSPAYPSINMIEPYYAPLLDIRLAQALSTNAQAANYNRILFLCTYRKCWSSLSRFGVMLREERNNHQDIFVARSLD